MTRECQIRPVVIVMNSAGGRAAYKYPVDYQSVEALPRNVTGKLVRRRLGGAENAAAPAYSLLGFVPSYDFKSSYQPEPLILMGSWPALFIVSM
jgi:hypothetical protein